MPITIGTPQGYLEHLRAAVEGYYMENGFRPDFILMTDDVARAIFKEVDANRNKYGGWVKIDGASRPMKLMGIEIGQIVGTNRVELASDLGTARARKALGGQIRQ